MSELMTTREVADYLRIKERKVYDLVHEGRIPCTRVTGKWLFPKSLIDHWVAAGTALPAGLSAPPTVPLAPAVVAGSHDPLLDWALREAGAALALMPGGSLDGVRRLADGEAACAGLHVLDEDSGDYNTPVLEQVLANRPIVAIVWAWRQQGLVVAAGNPMDIAGVDDLAGGRARVVARQAEAGSQILFLHLLAAAGIDPADVHVLEPPARSESDLAVAVHEGRADAGLAVEAAARQHGLGFVPLHRERYDLVMDRRSYFETPMQGLLAFARGPRFAERAAAMGGYDVSELGRVVWNARA